MQRLLQQQEDAISPPTSPSSPTSTNNNNSNQRIIARTLSSSVETNDNDDNSQQVLLPNDSLNNSNQDLLLQQQQKQNINYDSGGGTVMRRRGKSTIETGSPQTLLSNTSSNNSQQQQIPLLDHQQPWPSSADRRRSVSDGVLSYSSATSATQTNNNNNTQLPIPPLSNQSSKQQHPVNLQIDPASIKQQQPSSSTSPPLSNPDQTTENSNDEWLVVPILIVSSLPKEVDQILRWYTTGKQLKKQSPPCCSNEKSHDKKESNKEPENTEMNIIVTYDTLEDSPKESDKKESSSSNLDDDDDDGDDEQKDISPSSKQHQKRHASGRTKHHHHKSSSGNLSVSFQVPANEGTRRKASSSATEDSSQGNIQNIQEHIHQQLVLHENQEVKISAPSHKQPSSSSTKKASSSNLSKSSEKNPHKLNYYLRKNKRVTEWYMEEVCSLDYLSHIDEFLEKNEVNQISSLANDLLNTGINLEDLISIDEEEFFESVLEKSNHIPTDERRKIMFRVCHTGSRHALSLRQALYKQMILEQTAEEHQTIAPTTVIFVYSYTNTNYSLENTAMTWMKEINQIYPNFLTQGNFLLAGHVELNKSTKQQVALQRRSVEDSSANVGLVQKPKHYYHFHQKAVPLFQMKKNQRLTIVEFDTRLGTNIPQLFFESYRLYCLNQYRKKLNQALKPKPQAPPVPAASSGSTSPGNDPAELVTSPTIPSIPSQPEKLEDSKKKKEQSSQTDTNEAYPSTVQVNEEDHPKEEPKVSSPSAANLSFHKPETKPETKSEKTALPLGLLKIFKKAKKEETAPSKKPPVEKILKNLKKKKKKEDEIFRWHKIADNLIMSEKPKKKNKKDKQMVEKTAAISAPDDHRDVMSDTYFHNRKNMPLFPYSLHLMDQNDSFSPQFEKNNSNILSKPMEDDENPYLEDPTENDLMGEISESSSVPDTFEHHFTAVTNTNSSYPGEVIASDNEEADLDTENDIGSEVDDFTFQSSIGSATPQVLNATIFENKQNLDIINRSSNMWEELDQGEDMVSVGDIS